MKDPIKILIVDDDEDILKIVQFCFATTSEVRLSCAKSGEEALRLALEISPDLVLLDEMMPGMDGVTTLKALKLIPKFVNVPVIFLTAKAQKNEIIDYIRVGASDVIIKPFDPLSLPKIVLDMYTRYKKAG